MFVRLVPHRTACAVVIMSSENDVEHCFAGRWEAVSNVLRTVTADLTEYRNCELRIVGKHRSKWIQELMEYMSE